MKGISIITGILVLFTAASLWAQSSSSYNKQYTDRDEIIFQDRKYQQDTSPADSSRIRMEDTDASSSYSRSINQEPAASSQDRSYRKERFFQTGMASWYGKEFQGKVTASGERFDMYQLTAAHKSLPFGTILVVKNLETGKTVRVRVNDRGPYRGNRILDLSFNAARELGIVKNGKGMVGITILGTIPGQATADADNDKQVEPVVNGGRQPDSNDKEMDNSSEKYYGPSYSVQAGAFYSKRNAEKLTRKLEGMFKEEVVILKDGDMYKVRMRGIKGRQKASSYKRTLKRIGIPSFLMK